MEPILLKSIIPEKLIHIMNLRVNEILKSGLYSHDKRQFFRKGFHNDLYFKELHHNFISFLVQKYSKIPLKPSYSYLSIYDSPESICPLHIDRDQCYMTFSVCINQNNPWPFYVYPKFVEEIDYKDLDSIDHIKKNSLPYLLSPGDGLIYSGTKHPHWRNKIDPGNHCHMIFFHFVSPAFSEKLD